MVIHYPQEIAKSLFFLQNTLTSTSGVDHVGMYVGSGEVVHAKGPEGGGKIEKITLTDWLNLRTKDGKNYEDHFAGYGRVIAQKRTNTNPQIGDDVIILTSGGDFCIQKRGIITDIGNGFLCIQEIGMINGEIYDDICFGIGAIEELYWYD